MGYRIEPGVCKSKLSSAALDYDEFNGGFTALGDAVVDAETAVATENAIASGLASKVSGVFMDLIDQAYFAAKDNTRAVLENAWAAGDLLCRGR